MPDLAAKLCEDVLPNCGVASCQLDFSRGPRMIVDVCPLLAVATPSPRSGYELVIQRQLEQLTGPVIQLIQARGVPLREGCGRPYVRMFLSDSSGLHVGRQASWAAAEPHEQILGRVDHAGWIGPQPRQIAEQVRAPSHVDTIRFFKRSQQPCFPAWLALAVFGNG